MTNNDLIICWFSCGCTSAIACWLTCQSSTNCRVIYISTGQEEKDSFRFLKDCEQWFQHPIEIVSNNSFSSAFDVIEKTHYINGPAGARCTLELKKKVRWRIEDEIKFWKNQVFGFDASEKKRAQRFSEQYPNAKASFPLIERLLSKADCMAILKRHNIQLPRMYQLGYHNNNCVGCVKGGRGYWSKIRIDFPDYFSRMAQLERTIGHSCIKDCFLDELPTTTTPTEPIVPSCSLFCDPEFLDL